MIVEFLIAKWVEVVAGLLIMGCLLLFVFIMIIYEEHKNDGEDEFADLKRMMPKLPKEKKKK